MSGEPSDAARRTVRAAAAGVGSQVLWQVWSRALGFALKAAAVRAGGPRHFAFTEIRLGLMFAAIMPVAYSVRKIALRVPRDDTAAVLVFVGFCVTVALACAVGAAFVYWDPEHVGPILLTVLRAVFAGRMERGRVFAARREFYPDVSRARALSRIVNAVVTTVAVFVLPSEIVGLYATVLGDVAHAVSLWLLCEAAAGPVPIPRVTLPLLRKCVPGEVVRLCLISVWQRFFKTVLEKGEALVLDVTCVDSVKAAYQLSANVASMLARFFSEALEEQSFNVFSRFAPAFRRQAVSGTAEGSDTANGKMREYVEGEGSASQRSECCMFLQVAMKSALLVSLLIAFVGPYFSYALLRLLYGVKWADATPAPELLSQYFVYLVFMGVNGVSEALVMATAPSDKLKEHSIFTVALSAVYMVFLYSAGRLYGASGIIAVNCAKMAARIVYSSLYYADITESSAGSLVLSAVPHIGVMAILAVSSLMCGVSLKLTFGDTPPVDYSLFLFATVKHALSGAVSVGLFALGVYVYERKLGSYMGILMGREKEADACDSSGASDGLEG